MHTTRCTLIVLAVTAPQLRKELDAVLELQEDIEQLEVRIDKAQKAIGRGRSAALRDRQARIDALRVTQADLEAQAGDLYASLHIGDRFPSIADYGMEFVKTLVLAHDAKCAARAKITGRFFEWERLDRAVGGIGPSLGTTQHQSTLASMQRRTPALQNAIKKYNGLCDKLQELLPRGRRFPLPKKLPEDIAQLRDDPELLEDVWVEGDGEEADPWVTDATVRAGIRAMQMLDRCAEERVRVERETRQLYDWAVKRARALMQAIECDVSEYRSLYSGAHAYLVQNLKSHTSSGSEWNMPESRTSFQAARDLLWKQNAG